MERGSPIPVKGKHITNKLKYSISPPNNKIINETENSELDDGTLSIDKSKNK